MPIMPALSSLLPDPIDPADHPSPDYPRHPFHLDLDCVADCIQNFSLEKKTRLARNAWALGCNWCCAAAHMIRPRTIVTNIYKKKKCPLH